VSGISRPLHVDQVEKGELSYKEAQERYGIQGKTTVLTWLRKHGRQNWNPGAYLGSPRMGIMPEQNRPLTPEQRIKELEEQLALSIKKRSFSKLSWMCCKLTTVFLS